jgi:ABC-2 type transport system ATP-binding protein
MITIQNLSKSYGTNAVLKNLSVEFREKCCYGIVGANGAGKTTLFQCLVGLEKYAGDISSPFDLLKNHIGFLPTSPFFFTRITGREFLRLFCNARGINSSGLDKKNIFDLPLNQYASTYSTGMKKKLHLTAILLQKNDVYVLDEPFNGVDIQSNLIINDIISELKSRGKTVLMSSHILSSLRETCDEILLLKEGAIALHINEENFDSLEEELLDPTEKVDLDRLEF